MPHQNSDIARLGAQVAAHLDQITALFKKDTRITLIVRSTTVTDGSRDAVWMTDKIEDAIKALQTNLSRPDVTRLTISSDDIVTLQ